MVIVTKLPKKSSASNRSANSQGKRRKAVASPLLKSLPESMEHIEIVQQVASVLEELQKRVIDVKEEARKELKKLMNRYQSSYQGIEKKVHNVTLEAKKQAQTSMIHILQKWHEHKEKLPKPLAKEIEKIIEQVGMKVIARAASKEKKVSASSAKKPKAPSATKVKKVTLKDKKPGTGVRGRPRKTVVSQPSTGKDTNE